MSKISVGETSSGKIIIINYNKASRIDENFQEFTDRDQFEALLAFEYLILSESRRTIVDHTWLDALELTSGSLSKKLGNIKISQFKAEIASAFARRDFGKSLVYRHFRSL